MAAMEFLKFYEINQITILMLKTLYYRVNITTPPYQPYAGQLLKNEHIS